MLVRVASRAILWQLINMFICKFVRLVALAAFFCGAPLLAQQPGATGNNELDNASFDTNSQIVAEGGSVTIGNIRVQLISDSLVRLEVKGPEGFEDHKTFHIVDRSGPGANGAVAKWIGHGVVEIKTAGYMVNVPLNATSLDGVTVLSTNGDVLYHYDGHLENNRWLPAPSDHPQVWWFADTPRIVPPKWGLTPPLDLKININSGWDLGNDVPDVYVFVPHGDYNQLRADFLKLTGPSEMPPLFAFGAWDSRWYDYSEATALKQIDDYRAHKIPLDNLVVDTGWRQGASTGYQPNTNLFPNLPRFFQEAHDTHVHVMMNDHPEPVAKTALDPAELNYRFNGLSGLLNDGLDVWWYDRNWMVHLIPVPGINKEVWGMMLYRDTTARVRPDQRPMIMANVDGIDNGRRNRPMDVASHRYPIQWTGDIGPDFDYLRRAVENAVHSGVQSLFPYESDDLGGHVANPTTEQYIRWIEYGALSPVYRPHCTHNLERMPWAFGPQAENDARNYINMRYRLLPVFYTAAHENYETGEPLLRRLDLYYPDYPEARRDDEYFLGQYILVAPVLEGAVQTVPADWLSANGQAGLTGEYFSNADLSGKPEFTRMDAEISFNWDRKSPARDFPRENFSVRWTGTIEVPASIGDVKLSTFEDDGARVWIDGKLVIDAWGPHDSSTTEADTTMTAGVPHQIRVEYLQLQFAAHIKLLWRAVNSPNASREAWIPPGQWIDAWDGTVLTGPMMVTNLMPLDQIPMWIKQGAVLPLAPEMDYTGQKPWDPITLDIYPAGPGEMTGATLYEDDTMTTGYERGQFRTTAVSAYVTQAANKTVRVDINASMGDFNGALKTRSWKVRIHVPASWPKNLMGSETSVNGLRIIDQIAFPPMARSAKAIPFGDITGAPDGDVFEITLPPAPVSQKQSVEISFEPKR
jgi:alpha-glucosidase (family GH31 glycosyl hydrolase)